MECDRAHSLNNIGIVKMKLGDWDSSELHFKTALSLRWANEGRPAEERSSAPGNEELNLARLNYLRRRFDAAETLAELVVVREGTVAARKLRALAHEILGGCATEQGDKATAERHFVAAQGIAQEIAPHSDIMTGILRHRAQFELLRGDFGEATAGALECIHLATRIYDKCEMGAALRILGEAYVKLGLPKKAISAFEAGINTLKSIGECYELMRTCIAYGAFLVDAKSRDAEVYLLEARQMCKKLDIPYFMAQVLLLWSKYDHHYGNFESATTNLKTAGAICDSLQECDRKALSPEIKSWYKTLEKAILKASMESAEKLKSIGKIYEEARFPLEELKPELATEVARNVGAESLFLAQRRSGGLRIALKYNLSANDARATLRRQIKYDAETLFAGRDPRICRMTNGKVLVSVPGSPGTGYILCTVLEEGKTFTPRDLEFLFASVEALERVAEEYSTEKTVTDTGDFLDEDRPLRHPGGHFKSIITLDPELIRTIHLTERASQTNVPILLEGETGVGKELFARAIHANSPRQKNQFVAINAGGIPLNLLESQLFGHVKGAFTDAATDRVGLVEDAKGGTLFFDEVGEMSEELQVKLLRLLENGEFRRLGENTVRYADIRVISATNKDLQDRVKRELFREDLYFRLATVRFRIPPLRERKRDIEFLTRHFLNEGLEKIGKPRRLVHVDLKALEAFEIYPWPGNVRELKNEILRILSLIGEGEVIRFGMLSERIKDAFRSKNEGGVLTKSVERFERRLILKALEENDWNRSKTADQIGIPRTTLLFKMKQLDITA